MEDHWEDETDKDARDRAEQIVNDAIRVLMKGITFSSPDRDSPRLRAHIAIQHIVDVLYELAEAYQLYLLSETNEPEGDRPPRWTATVWYRSNAGPVDVVHIFEEVHTLHDLIELGPSFNCIERIEIRLSTPAPDQTLESSLPGSRDQLEGWVRAARRRKSH